MIHPELNKFIENKHRCPFCKNKLELDDMVYFCPNESCADKFGFRMVNYNHIYGNIGANYSLTDYSDFFYYLDNKDPYYIRIDFFNSYWLVDHNDMQMVLPIKSLPKFADLPEKLKTILTFS